MAAVLAGCGGSMPSPQIGAASAVVSLDGEKFSSTDVDLKTYYCGSGGYPFDILFTVKGKATGPYPGTFTASGQWDVYLSTPFHGKRDEDFDENFTIRSGDATIKGRATWAGDGNAGCYSFGPNTAKWRTTNQNPNTKGSLAVTIIKSGKIEETFK